MENSHVVVKKRGSFFRAPLMYVFMFLGSPIGRYVGMNVDFSTARQAGLYVGVFSVMFMSLGAALGYILSRGIDSIFTKRSGRIISKWAIGVIGFFIYFILLDIVRYRR